MAGVGRLFVAITPPDAAVHALAARLHAAFSERPVPGSPVDPGRWHITLRFLGEVGEVGRDRVLAALDEADLGPPRRVALGGLGAFPQPDRANVLWVGVDDTPDLRDLVGRVEDACAVAGLEAEERPFIGHLTISRMRPAVDVWPWLEADADLEVTWMMDAVTLLASHRRAGGLVYETVERFPLA